MAPIHQIFYTSVAPAPLGSTGIADLLVQAREKNERLGVTGILVYHNRQFMQILEGEADTVRALFETIRRDSRHRSVEVLYEASTPERAFRRWAMGYFNLGDYPASEIAAFEQFVDARLETLRADPGPASARALYDVFTKMLLGGGAP